VFFKIFFISFYAESSNMVTDNGKSIGEERATYADNFKVKPTLSKKFFR